MPVITVPERTTVTDFRAIHEAVETAMADGRVAKIPDYAGEFDESRTVFQDHADAAHYAHERFVIRFGESGPGKEFAPDAAASMAFYQQKKVDVSLTQSQYAGYVGAMHMADGAWTRLSALATGRGVDIHAYDGLVTGASPEKGETTLDEGQMTAHAAALESLVDGGAGNRQLETSSLETASEGFQNASSAVVTAQHLAVSEMVSVSRSINQKKDDKAAAELAKIERLATFAEEFVDVVQTTMGNMAAIQSNIAMWQTSFKDNPMAVVLGDDNKLEIQTGEFVGPDALANLKSYVGSSANLGGAMIRFIFDGEIKRCRAAIRTVERHEAAFQAVVDFTAAKGRIRNLEDKMAGLQTAAQSLADEAEKMRTNAVNFGAEVDAKLQRPGSDGARPELPQGQESAVGYMMELACLREALAYHKMAHAAGRTAQRPMRDMSSSLRGWQRTSHWSKDMAALGQSRGVEGELNRYASGARTITRINEAVSRRAKHLDGLAATFVGALGGRGSTDGNDRY